MKTTVFSIAVLFAVMASAGNLISYQGKLLDNQGQPVNGSVDVTVKLHDKSSGGTEVYIERIGPVAVQNGLYSFSFGADQAALGAALTNKECWIQIHVNGQPLSPKKRLYASAYTYSVSEANLTETTDFLLQLVAKHEQELAWLWARQGMDPKQLVMPLDGYVVAGFATPDGRGVVDTNATTAFWHPDNKAYVPLYCLKNEALVSGQGIDVAVKAIPVNDRVQLVRSHLIPKTSVRESKRMEVERIVFAYADGTAASQSFDSLVYEATVTLANPYPEKVVSTITISVHDRLAEDGTQVAVPNSDAHPAKLVLNVPATSKRISNTGLFGISKKPVRTAGKYKVKNAAQEVANIPFNVKWDVTALTSNPTQVEVTFDLSATEDDALDSVMLRYWTE